MCVFLHFCSMTCEFCAKFREVGLVLSLFLENTHFYCVCVFFLLIFVLLVRSFVSRCSFVCQCVGVCCSSLSLSSIGHGCVFHAPVSSIMTLRDVAPSTNNSHLIQNSLSFTVYIRARCIFSLSLVLVLIRMTYSK